ncbi:hypothetical protein SSX86_001810 [Deinandra increscens subsp. villosa]|uniref:Uncharacterized protein n=1 Tax=Deinandra increscens subsp. villosa TaxID=3103831 RepID=A0AAP0DVJ6_9ASTR
MFAFLLLHCVLPKRAWALLDYDGKVLCRREQEIKILSDNCMTNKDNDLSGAIHISDEAIRYLDMLPTTFGNPVWFSEDELLELRGTTLFSATELQKTCLHSLYDEKVKELVKMLLILDGDSERLPEVAVKGPTSVNFFFSHVRVGQK